MDFHVLSPGVGGGLGERSELDTSVHPPSVHRLHYEVEGWTGDALLESFPCYLVSPLLAEELEAGSLTGAQLADAEVTIAPGAEDVVDTAVLGFRWLQPRGAPGRDDVAADDKARLIVSDRALAVLRRHPLENCLIEQWG